MKNKSNFILNKDINGKGDLLLQKKINLQKYYL